MNVVRSMRATYTAFEGRGEHDDLVIAAALVAWWAGHVPAEGLDAAP